MEEKEESKFKCGRYTTYTNTEWARLGKHAAMNDTTTACQYFSQHWKRQVPEATVRHVHLKDGYLQKLSEPNMQKATLHCYLVAVLLSLHQKVHWHFLVWFLEG